MPEKAFNTRAEFEFLKTAANATLTSSQKKRISDGILEHLLIPTKEPYFKVRIALKRKPDGSPKFVIIFMLRAYTYTCDIAQLKVDREFRVISAGLVPPGTITDFDFAMPQMRSTVRP